MEKTVSTSPPPQTPPAQGAPRQPGREIEVKLECSPQLVSSFFGLEPLAAAVVRPRGQRLFATYFDTPDDALNRAGMSLRLRKNGVRRIMTLKWTPEGSDRFSRGEAETPCSDVQPDLDAFVPEVARRVQEAARGEPLVPRFETRVRRRLADLSLGSSRVEVVLDDGEIIASERRAKISECELELKEGDPAVLFALAAQLTRAGLRLNPLSKAQRGILLARGEKPSEVRAVAGRLEESASIEAAMSAIIQNALTQFVDNWPALLDGELPESVHQMRVALRRLRAALSLFERALPGAGFRRFRDEAKRFADALGPARDQDVFIEFVSGGPQTIFPDEPSFEALLSSSATRRLDAYRQAKEAVVAPDASRFVLELHAFVASRGWRNALGTEQLPQLGRPARSLADEALERLYRRARKLGKEIMTAEPEQRHRLRIALKNLRYAAEFFGSLYEPGVVRKFTRAASVLQDALGAHNDSDAALKLIQQDASLSDLRAAGIVLGWCACENRNPWPYLNDRWLRFKKARCFWR
jgi:inorganic triphosphatase YgiF